MLSDPARPTILKTSILAKGQQLLRLDVEASGAPSPEMERRLIGSMLLQTSHNKTRAAEKLGISLRTLRNKLREYRAAGYDTTKPELWVA